MGWIITDRLNEKINLLIHRTGIIMATLSEAVEGWKSYTAELKSQRDAAVAALEEANNRAQTAADALSAFQADDAQTDAQQLADQAQADADFVQGELDKVQTPVEEPPVISEPVEETPPAEAPAEQPVEVTPPPADVEATPPEGTPSQ